MGENDKVICYSASPYRNVDTIKDKLLWTNYHMEQNNVI
jgi:hypothetical protein